MFEGIYFLYTNQIFPTKTPKLSSGGPATLARQDTIDEGGEGGDLQLPIIVATLPPASGGHRPSIQLEHRPTLERQPTERDRLLEPSFIQRERDRAERNLALERERQIEMACSRATTSDTYDSGLREQPITNAQRDLIATVLDMKVDVSLEMQRMSQRIGRLEDLLSELIKRLSVDSSGQTTPGGAADETTGPAALTTTITVSAVAGCSATVATTPSSVASASVASVSGTGSGGIGLGPLLLRKRRSKSRKAPAPPRTSPEQTRLLEAEPQFTSPVAGPSGAAAETGTSSAGGAATTSSRTAKRGEYL